MFYNVSRVIITISFAFGCRENPHHKIFRILKLKQPYIHTCPEHTKAVGCHTGQHQNEPICMSWVHCVTQTLGCDLYYV